MKRFISLNMGKSFPALVLVLAILFSACLFEAKRIITIQNTEITDLQEKVHHLMGIMNYEIRARQNAEAKE